MKNKIGKTKAQWIERFHKIKHEHIIKMLEKEWGNIPDDYPVGASEVANLIMKNEHIHSIEALVYMIWGETEVSREVAW